MKVRPSVKKICDRCRVIRRRGTDPGHLHEPAAQAASRLEEGDGQVARIAGVDLPRDKRLDIALTLHLRRRRHQRDKIVDGAEHRRRHQGARPLRGRGRRRSARTSTRT